MLTILYASINEVLAKIDNRYYLVGTVAKRAREIVDGSEPYVDSKVNKGKPVMLATEEIAEGKITYRLLTEEEIQIAEALHAEEQSKLIEE